MAGATVRDGTANLAMADAVADVTRTVSLEAQRSSLAAPPRLRPAQADKGAKRTDPVENPAAAHGLSNDCAPLQSTVGCKTRHDGEQAYVADTCRRHQYLILMARQGAHPLSDRRMDKCINK